MGGYVAFPDDEPGSDAAAKYAKDDPDLMRNRPLAQRALVISAGVIANLIFAWTVLFAQARVFPRSYDSVRAPFRKGAGASSVP